LSGADLIVDALLGTGLDRAVTGAMQHTIEAINESNSAVLAVDLPSGLDSDTGSPLGDAVRADATATFACWKRGFLELESLRWTGEIYTIDIGAPQSLCERLGAAIETATRHGRGG
jgi:NAD(P)H-hydrate epimerase